MKSLILAAALAVAFASAHAQADVDVDYDLTMRGWELEIEALHWQCMRDDNYACVMLLYRLKTLEWQDNWGQERGRKPA